MGKAKFFLQEAASSLRRNYFMTAAALLTVLLTMTVLGVVMVSAANIDAMLADLEQKVEITVYLEESATAEEIQECRRRSSAGLKSKTRSLSAKKKLCSGYGKTWRIVRICWKR